MENNKTKKYLFNRKYTIKNIDQYNQYLLNCKPNFSIEDTKWLFFNIKKYFNSKNYHFFVIYCFDFVREWINSNEEYSDDYILNLENLIKKLKLKNLLNSFENEYINHFKSVVFSKKRNIKQLIVDFPLLDQNKNVFEREKAYYIFENTSLIQLINNKEIVIINNCNLYITDNRIVFSSHIDYLSFYIDKIISYKLTKKAFEFEYNNKKYLVITENKYEFFVSYERIIDFVR